MTWSNPTTRSTGDLITAAIWNQDVVDNLKYLYDNQGMTRIDSATLTGSATDITISSIPATYEALLVKGSLRSDRSATSDTFSFQLNGVGGTSYEWVRHRIIDPSTNDVYNGAGDSKIFGGSCAAASGTTNFFGSFHFWLWNYANADMYKEVLGLSGHGESYSSYRINGTYKSTSAVSSIKFYPDLGTNFLVDSTVTVYGLIGA